MNRVFLHLAVSCVLVSCASNNSPEGGDPRVADASAADATSQSIDAAVCESTVVDLPKAPRPVDVIVVVDTSATMSDEATDTQAQLNQFVDALAASGLDPHLVLVAADSSAARGVCVPAPLGSGACPADEKLPGFRHVGEIVGSSNALQKVLDAHPVYADSLRDGSSRAIVVMSDDDSSLDAASFSSALIALDADFDGVRFHAYVGPYAIETVECTACFLLNGNCALCDPCCGANSGTGQDCATLVADQGSEYSALAESSGGVEGDLCSQDISPLLQEASALAIADANPPCRFAPPEDAQPSTAMGAVEVSLVASGAGSEPLPFVGVGAENCADLVGWYYDDSTSPGAVMLCEVACSAYTADSEATVSLGYGCPRSR